ncbi:phosphatase PAP2 family protein [Pontibacter chinhatensis]|nr:phosphatase PAP2 family protein [Pontibacter chinhatensis]
MGLPVAAAIATRRRTVLSPVAKGAAVLVAGAGIWVATFAWGDEPLQQYTQSHRTPTSDALSSVVQPLGKQGYMAPLAGAAFAGGVLLKDEKLQKAGLLSLGSILISAGVTGTLKNQFHRYRPSDTGENHYFDGPVHASAHTSLPSAHTATAFAVATSVAAVYGPEHRCVPPLAYGVATLVGLSRIHDNAHWTTDVMAGAVVGYLSAKGANYLYDMARLQRRIHKQRRLLIMPQPGIQSGSVSATLVF